MRRWDIFCKVIDNFGDIGVCWRLARDLAERGQTVRLWLDDASALQWLAPGEPPAGLSVEHWPAGESSRAWPEPGDVVIEAFGCDPPGGFLARMQRPCPPVWINLEYLSAEDYVERSHKLPSPVFSGPATGLRKHFFYPGFTPRTGGLLREPSLLAARDVFQGSVASRQDFLQRLGVDWQAGERVVTVFCYPDSPVCALLRQLEALPGRTQVLLTAGTAAAQAKRCPGSAGTGLRCHELNLLPQQDFDRLLWASDLNVVRGEDSAVRALWTGRPHLWQLYRQDDGVHADKLAAFHARWTASWPAPLREAVQSVGAAWNQVPGSRVEDLGLLRELCGPDTSAPWASWADFSAASSQELAKQPDLVTQLLQFVAEAG